MILESFYELLIYFLDMRKSNESIFFLICIILKKSSHEQLIELLFILETIIHITFFLLRQTFIYLKAQFYIIE